MRSFPSIWTRRSANPISRMKPTLGQYITEEEAELRYANLKKWYKDHGHFWVGTGPYYLDKVFPDREDSDPEEQHRFP